jgi:Pyrroline-5-carboxylate reductase
MIRVTIIGAGNMGGATAVGLLESGSVKAENLTLTAKHMSSLERFAAMGVRTLVDNAEAVKGADIVILAVKPWIVPEVCREIARVLDFGTQQIVSMAPGVSPEDLLSFFPGHGRKPSLSYVIPNTAIEVGESMTFVSGITSSDEQVEEIAGLFSGSGTVTVVPYRQLSAGTALASCGIAYAFRYIRAAAEGGVELGFYAKDAVRIVAQTVKGAAELLEVHGSHPEQEIDKVTTPGGLTIRGLNAMEEAGFTTAVIKGLKGGR